MTNKNTPEYLIVDWGTSNLRIFLMSHNDSLLSKKESTMGLLKVENGNFAAVLESILMDWLPNFHKLPIFMAGMVGSANGWFAVDYVDTHVNLRKLSNKSYHFDLPWSAPATIIPGIVHCNNNTKDVMRGEEIQVFGLLEHIGINNIKNGKLTAILPGTHSKHVSVYQDEITEISSFMTGELFSVISQHTILGKGLPIQHFNSDAFSLGVQEGQTTQLTRVLFQARTHKLFNIIKDEHVESYLSGLLIGNELQHVDKQPVYLIGSPNLCNSYQLACDILAIPATCLNGDECFISGMIRLKQNLIFNKN